MVRKFKFIDLYPGAAPVEAIYATLGIEMDAGNVKCSAPALSHAAKRHPDDVSVILPHLSDIISHPLYMGDDFRNPGKIELVGKIAGRTGAALVAVTVVLNANDGHYHVCSMYLITQSELDKKRDKGILKVTRI
ncbi:PBECR3 domain-containing polyvalent protein [Neogemmobacter tilapiae]|uniref:Phage-Barnase-EndoU-ColicinE5/D-RelE like nuclease 3 domain-containing protein n=1 Tax=Neogemmobacter tilapiae TaxID=875041 RepID=A0A918WEQ9_9RHOB|nr:hypothetical protein [Gemmobacter tilapiae]GHC44294.1 hypothetical protein GCM10007315_01830 [Gemmobacter tilapiae]